MDRIKCATFDKDMQNSIPIEIREKIKEIERYEKQIELFNNTKEFCKIEIRGENGAERAYSFTVTYDKDNDIVEAIRSVINDKLKERQVKLLKDIKHA